MNELDQVREVLHRIDTTDVRSGLEIAKRIGGLGTAGASGLFAVMYPSAFATVGQFVVKA